MKMRLHDNWYRTDPIARHIIAIGEPKYHQLNWSYLITGATSALMFDTGPGERNIRPCAESLTSLPITAMPSHLHFDHVGGLKYFDEVAFADLPILRAMERGGLIHAPEGMVLGEWEKRFWTPVAAAHWHAPGNVIDLGAVRLEVIHTPGHSPDSVSLFDRAANILLAADVLYPGPLYAQIPNAHLPDYLATVDRLVDIINEDTIILCGHGDTPESPAPRMTRQDLRDIRNGLTKIRDGSVRPVSKAPFCFPINAAMTLLASEASFATWQIPAEYI
jgi:hydroxyacylglutathione hydrolase